MSHPDPVIGFHKLADLAIEVLWHGLTHTTREAWDAAVSMPSVSHLFGLARHASTGRESPKFVEIGVQRGASTMTLLASAAFPDVNGHLYSMDIDPSCGEGELRQKVRAAGLESRWTFIGKPSQQCATISETDFLLVDGDHSYEAVCADMALHGCAVRTGGIIIIDDYYMEFPGKVRWVQERWKELAPIVIGPHVVLVKREGNDDVYRLTYPGETWTWDV